MFSVYTAQHEPQQLYSRKTGTVLSVFAPDFLMGCLRFCSHVYTIRRVPGTPFAIQARGLSNWLPSILVFETVF